MIKNWVARSMQISCIEELEILMKLHATEIRLGYILPNWNVQTLLNLPDIKTIHQIPEDDNESQERHQRRIESDIDAQGLKVKSDDENLEWTHNQDWMIFRNKGKIVWEYSGGKLGGILQRLKKQKKDLQSE